MRMSPSTSRICMAALPDFGVHLRAWNLLAPSQLLQPHFNFIVQPLTQGLAIFAQFKPFQQRFGLHFIQVLDFFNRQFDVAHDSKITKHRLVANRPLGPNRERGPRLGALRREILRPLLNCAIDRRNKLARQAAPARNRTPS
jgi:hypothetical protein